MILKRFLWIFFFRIFFLFFLAENAMFSKKTIFFRKKIVFFENIAFSAKKNKKKIRKKKIHKNRFKITPSSYFLLSFGNGTTIRSKISLKSTKNISRPCINNRPEFNKNSWIPADFWNFAGKYFFLFLNWSNTYL